MIKKVLLWFKMPEREQYCFKATKKSTQSLLKYVNIFAIIVLILSTFHFCNWNLEEEKKVFETWWVWELSDEGTTKTIKPIEWGETADNNEVMGIIDFKPKKRVEAPDSYENIERKSELLNHEKSGNTNNNLMRDEVSVRDVDAATKRIVILGKRALPYDYRHNQTLCGKCVLSYNIDDVFNADAVVIDQEYAQNQKIPQRR